MHVKIRGYQHTLAVSRSCAECSTLQRVRVHVRVRPPILIRMTIMNWSFKGESGQAECRAHVWWRTRPSGDGCGEKAGLYRASDMVGEADALT